MQQATGPNFSAAREKAVAREISEEMSHDMNWNWWLEVGS
jgi:hypothetical protein